MVLHLPLFCVCYDYNFRKGKANRFVFVAEHMNYLALKDVCCINMGQSPDSKSYNDSKEGIPFFQGNADFGERYPITRVWCNAPTKIAEKDDILISVRAPIGALNYAKETCCIGRGLAAITPNKTKVSTEFIFWLLKEKNNELNRLGTGSTFKAISKKILEETKVPDISLEKQTAYSNILEKLYSIITHLRTQLEKLDLLVKARFVEMFGDTEYNTKKFPVYKLSELCTVSSSKRIYQDEQSSTGVPFLRISNLVELIETGHLKNELFISDEKYIELVRSNLVPQKGDILVTSRGTLGKCYIVQDDDKFYFQDGMISWLYNLNKAITPLYLALLFNTKNIKTQIDNLQSGSTVAYLSITMLKKLNIVVPPLTLQNQFADFVKQIDKSKSILQQELDKAQMLFDSLMQEYFG